MKKTLAILLAMTMAFSAVALAVAADFDVTLDGTKYTVIQPESIEFVPMVKDEANGVSNVPQGGCTLDALIDGINAAVNFCMTAGAMMVFWCGIFALMEDSGLDCDQLITMVASKGGTTEASLRSFSENGFNDVVDKAMRACTQRAKELGGR